MCQERFGILDKVSRGITFLSPKQAVELMLLIPIMGMDNARPLRRFSGKEDHFTNLLFHNEYFYAVLSQEQVFLSPESSRIGAPDPNNVDGQCSSAKAIHR